MKSNEQIYRVENKGWLILLSRIQAEQLSKIRKNSFNHVPTTIHYPVGFVPNIHIGDTTLHDGIFYLEEHPSPAIHVWETNWAGMGWEEERLLGQTACSHAGVPLQPAAARGRSCTTTIKKKSSLPSQWSDQTSDQPAYNNDSGGGGNNGLCDVTRDGRGRTDGTRMLSSLCSSRTHLSLSRGFRYEGIQGGHVEKLHYAC